MELKVVYNNKTFIKQNTDNLTLAKIKNFIRNNNVNLDLVGLVEIHCDSPGELSRLKKARDIIDHGIALGIPFVVHYPMGHKRYVQSLNYQ